MSTSRTLLTPTRNNDGIVELNITENGNIISLEDKLVIFPKYVKCLMDNGVRVDVHGDRIAERKLTSMMMSWILTPNKSIPDIALFSVAKKEWMYCYVDQDCTVKLRRKGYDYMEYFPGLMDDAYNTTYQTMLCNYIRVYSSAKVSLK